MSNPLTKFIRTMRAWIRMPIFLLRVSPMLPSKPVDWVTKKPIVEKVTYPTLHGPASGDLYRPSGKGQHRAIVVCLGVVPFETEHPQVPRRGEALARSGFAALLYWSPAMHDLRSINISDFSRYLSQCDRLRFFCYLNARFFRFLCCLCLCPAITNSPAVMILFPLFSMDSISNPYLLPGISEILCIF